MEKSKSIKSVSFILEIEPTGKERPRFNSKTGRTYTPSKTKNIEKYIKELYQYQVKEYFKGYVRLEINAYYKIPKSDTKKNKELKLQNVIRPNKKPDIDNVIKLIADSLNEIAYKDDTQIVEIVAKKYYSEQPRIEVKLIEI